MGELQTFTLPAGTVCHRNGIPFQLLHATQIECHPGNWLVLSAEAGASPACHVTLDGTPCGTSVGLDGLPGHSRCPLLEPADPSAHQATSDKTGMSTQRTCKSLSRRMLLAFLQWLRRERS